MLSLWPSLFLCACLEQTTGDSKPLDDAFIKQLEGQPTATSQDNLIVTGEVTAERAGTIDVEIEINDPASPRGMKHFKKEIIETPGQFSFEIPKKHGAHDH